MSFLNLMGNKLKPKEVNDALLNAGSSSGESGGGDTPVSKCEVKTFSWNGDGNAPHTKTLPEDVGIILDIEQNDTGSGYTVMPFVLKSSGKYVIVNRGTNDIANIAFSYDQSTRIMTFGAGAVGLDEVFNRGGNSYTMYYLPIETS